MSCRKHKFKKRKLGIFTQVICEKCGKRYIQELLDNENKYENQ